MWKKTNAHPPDTTLQKQIQSQLEQEQLQISRIQKQRDMIGKLQQSFFKKQQEIERLNALVDKYRPYYENCSAMRLELAEKDSALRTYAKENQLLKREFEELITETERIASQLKSMELQKQALMRERHSIERVNRQIEQTFKEYQAQCRRREHQLLAQLEDHLKLISSLQTTIETLKQAKPHEQSAADTEDLALLRQELSERERQLQKQKLLNHELSIEFDKSVNKICQFQKELNNYRIQNHELKKTLGLVLEQDKYQKLHQKYMHKKEPLAKDSQSQQDQEQSLNHSSPQMSQIKF